MLQFLAYILYVESHATGREGARLSRDCLLLLSGGLLGMATAVRSNGLFSGLLFAYDAFNGGMNIWRGQVSADGLRRLAVTVVSGSLVAVGAALPQVVAYQEYCTPTNVELRPWCNALPPSIYTFVQSHYWYLAALPSRSQNADHIRNVGFLRYWTVSNIPLFLLAAPMLLIMAVSSVWAFRQSNLSAAQPKKRSKTPAATAALVSGEASMLPLFAAPQALVVIVTLTTSHVQIVSRLSSAYPVWYWWLANMMVDGTTSGGHETMARPKMVVRWMVIYAIIQGGLYASFLPPA